MNSKKAATIFPFAVLFGCISVSHATTQYGLCGTAENRWSGVPLDGRFNAVYRLCDAASGGSCPWEEDPGKIDIEQGSFCLVIGATIELPDGEEGLDYLEIEIEGDELERMQLFGVPRARIADKAIGLSESVVTTETIEEGTN